MPLKIQIVSFGSEPVEGEPPVVFDMTGGSIGRSQDNVLVLPDESKCISRSHAHISYENGRYYLVDTSKNCSLIVNRDIRLQSESAELYDGDRIRIGDYEMSVSIKEARQYAPEAPSGQTSQPMDFSKGSDCIFDDEFNIDDFFKDSVVIKRPSSPEPDPLLKILDEEAPDIEPVSTYPLEPDTETSSHSVVNLLDDAAEPPSQPAVEPIEATEFLSSSVVKPDGAAVPVSSPAVNSSVAAEAKSQPEVKPHEAAPPATPQAGGELFDLFLQGARMQKPGYVKEEDIPDVMVSLGAVFRELVKGLWSVLRGRAQEKSELRAEMTSICQVNNNPLKFSPALEDALGNLIKRQHPAFMEPVDAAHDGFEDIMYHNLGMSAGVQASLIELLNRFDPERFAEKHKEKFSLSKKSKCWDDFCQSYGKLREEASEDFFGKVFVKAYEEQIERLRSTKRTAQHLSSAPEGERAASTTAGYAP